MKLSFLKGSFKINPIPLFLFIGVLSLLLNLGFWQLDRAELKREHLVKQQEKMRLKPIALSTLLATDDEIRYRQVKLKGHYDIAHQILVDNQIIGGVVGGFVLTPFILNNNNKRVLVNRGWLAMSKNRLELPEVKFTPPTNDILVAGIINKFPSVGLVLEGADEPSNSWPAVVQIINSDKISNKLKQPIYDFQVQLMPDQPYGYTRDWQINTRMPPEKHIAYAVQWFALGLTLTILIFWISYKKDD